MKEKLRKRVAKVIENVEILDKRVYFSVDSEYRIKRKKMNYIVPALIFCENENIFLKTLELESNSIEREKFKKIERLSNLSILKLQENFIKLVIKGELEFSKRYGKELALRDKNLFLETLFNLSLMDNIEFNKPLLALSMKKIMDNFGWIDEIGYLVISYFSKQKFDLNAYEQAKELSEMNLEIDSENISQLAYKKVLESFNYKNKNFYSYMLKNSYKKTKEQKKNGVINKLTNIEKEILKQLKD